MIKKHNIEKNVGSHEHAQSFEVIVKLKLTKISARRFSSREFVSNKDVFSELVQSGSVDSISPLFPAVNRQSFGLLSKENFAVGDREIITNDNDQELDGLKVVKFFSEQQAAAGVMELSKDHDVEYAHIPSIRKFALSGDPDQNRQWGLRAIDYFTAVSAGGYNNGKAIKIAILDSGIDPNHPDLAGIYLDNINFTTLGADDDSGHGTHVAGIIAALTNNGIGITGVCESNQLMVLRGLTDPYQPTAYYNAIRYAFDNGTQVLNCSLGGPFDPTEALLIKIAISKGVVVVAAMGNEYQHGNATSYPAALPDVIAVGASDETDHRGDFSQTGSHIHLMAPGTNILSTVPTYKVPLTSKLDYDAWNGTSMATPFVTAAVALMLAKNPGATLPDIKDALANSASKMNGQTIYTNELGHGLLDLAKAISMI